MSASTFNGVNAISLDHFERFTFYVSDVQTGDIIGWGPQTQPDHVCYVTAVFWPDPGNIRVAQVENEGSTTEQPNLTLSNVINGTGGARPRGYPTMMFRKRPRWSIKLQNSFAGGTVGIGTGPTPPEHPSGYTVSNLHWESAVAGVAVMDGREFQGYIRRFSNWSSDWGYSSGSVTSSLPVLQLNFTTISEFTANLSREFDITFQNSFAGASGGQIKVNGVASGAPQVAQIRETNPAVTGEALYQVISGIEYIFSYWTNTLASDTVWSSPATFYPSDHATYTAHFDARPLAPANITLGGEDYVHITWSEHPHSSVTQYQIWRTVEPYDQTPARPN